MMRLRRKGFTLVELMCVLPAGVIVATLSYQLVVAIGQARAVEQRSLNDAARILEMERWLRADADASSTAQVQPGSNGWLELVLQTSRGRIVYRLRDQDVVRHEQPGGAGPFQWTFEATRLTCTLEDFPEGGQVVWLMFTSSRRVDRGHSVEHRLARAVHVGRGGAS